MKTILKRAIQVLLMSGAFLMTEGCRPHYVAQVPAAPVEVVPVAPYPNAVWVGGGWAWRGGRHVYVPGYYAKPRAGRVYNAGEWRQGPRGHYYVRGRWR